MRCRPQQRRCWRRRPPLQWLASRAGRGARRQPRPDPARAGGVPRGGQVPWLTAGAAHPERVDRPGRAVRGRARTARLHGRRRCTPTPATSCPRRFTASTPWSPAAGWSTRTRPGEHPWLAQEIQLVREALVRRTPYMGLCLGAQVLTEAAGGTVYRCTRTRSAGTRSSCRRPPPVTPCSTACRSGSRRCSGTTTPAARQRRRRADDQPGVAAGAAGRRRRLGHPVPHRGDPRRCC